MDKYACPCGYEYDPAGAIPTTASPPALPGSRFPTAGSAPYVGWAKTCSRKPKQRLSLRGAGKPAPLFLRFCSLLVGIFVDSSPPLPLIFCHNGYSVLLPTNFRHSEPFRPRADLYRATPAVAEGYHNAPKLTAHHTLKRTAKSCMLREN